MRDRWHGQPEVCCRHANILQIWAIAQCIGNSDAYAVRGTCYAVLLSDHDTAVQRLGRDAPCRTLKYERAIAYKGGLNKHGQDLLVRFCDRQNKNLTQILMLCTSLQKLWGPCCRMCGPRCSNTRHFRCCHAGLSAAAHAGDLDVRCRPGRTDGPRWPAATRLGATDQGHAALSALVPAPDQLIIPKNLHQTGSLWMAEPLAVCLASLRSALCRASRVVSRADVCCHGAICKRLQSADHDMHAHDVLLCAAQPPPAAASEHRERGGLAPAIDRLAGRPAVHAGRHQHRHVDVCGLRAYVPRCSIQHNRAPTGDASCRVIV